MKKPRNTLSMSFYNGEQRRLFLEYVDTIQKSIKWVDQQNIQWTHAMVYKRKTREKVARIVKENGEPVCNYY